jgi:hypothetical protein
MTREEEKLKAADEYIKNRIKQGQGMTGDVFPVFIEGIEFADANPDRNTFACISLVSAEQAKKQMIDKACDAYCKICGHFAHTTPTHICRHDCIYYSDFVKQLKE